MGHGAVAHDADGIAEVTEVSADRWLRWSPTEGRPPHPAEGDADGVRVDARQAPARMA